MVIPVSKLADHPVAESALLELCKPFVPASETFDPECAIVQPDQIPFPQDHAVARFENEVRVPTRR